MNNVTLVGRLTKDVDLRYTPNGVAVATFTMAVPRKFADTNGERGSNFINCVVWRKQAENMANYTEKGQRVGVSGEIQSRNYESQNGDRVYVTEVLAENVTFLDKPQNNNGNNR